MLEVKNFEIAHYNINHCHLTWEIADTFEHVNEFVFEIWRSESPEGEYKQHGAVVNNFEFYDNDLNQYSKHREFYYKMIVRNFRNGKETVVGPINLYRSRLRDPEILANEIRRRNNLLLNKFNGRYAAILKIRTFGERCSECWDKIKKACTKSMCRTCFRTGYRYGYYNPVFTYINTNPSAKQVRLEEIGELQPGEKMMWLSNHPLLSPRDLIVFEDTHKRYRVVDRLDTSTEMLGVPVHQVIRTFEIPASDVEYLVPVEEFGSMPIVIGGIAVYKYQEIESYDGGTITLQHAERKDQISIYGDYTKIYPSEYEVADGILTFVPGKEPAVSSHLLIVTTFTEE